MATDTTHYDLGHGDGYEMACDSEARDGRDCEIEHVDDASGATTWDSNLINAIGSDEAARYLGLTSLYDDGVLTGAARAALTEYNRGATAGWNQRVEELANAEEV